MKHEKLYAFLDYLDDDLVLESAEVKKRTWRGRLLIALCVFVILAVVYVASTWTIYHPPEDVGGTPGVLQDGAYYVYAGSGFPIPGQRAVPRGIWRYVPGEGKELLVDTKERQVFSIVPDWSMAINSHSLYYTDRQTLWRLDLETREETVLFQCGQTDGVREEENLILHRVEEDTVVIQRWKGDQADWLTLDSRTGRQVRPPELPQDTVQTVTLSLDGAAFALVPHPAPADEVTELFGDFTKYGGQYYWYDLQFEGRSLLPPGWRTDPGSCQDLGSVLSVGGWRYTGTDADGHQLSERKTFLFDADGSPVPFEAEPKEGVWLIPLAAWDGWLCFTRETQRPGYDTPASDLMVRNIETGQERVLLEHARFLLVITDGTWLYSCDGSVTGHTDCWRIDYDDQGNPTGLTLIEDNI